MTPGAFIAKWRASELKERAAAHEPLREIAEQGAVLALGSGRLDHGSGLLARIGGGHLPGCAEDGLGHAELARGAHEEGLVALGRDLEAEAAQVLVEDGESALVLQLFPEGAAQGALVDGGMDAHGRSPVSVPLDAARSEGTRAALPGRERGSRGRSQRRTETGLTT